MSTDAATQVSGRHTPAFGVRLREAMATYGPLCAGVDPHRALLHGWGLDYSVAGLERFAMTCAEAFAGRVAAVRQIVSRHAGVLRDEDGLATALTALQPYLDTDAGLVAELLVSAARGRTESRGAHTRTDHPGTVEPAEHTHTAALEGAAR